MQAIHDLPKSIQEEIENVEFVLEEGESPGGHLLGLYHGIPHIKRGNFYSWVLPDKITIYKGTIEQYAHGREDLSFLVRRVVWHEIGHHFGFSESAIRKLEEKWKKKNFML